MTDDLKPCPFCGGNPQPRLDDFINGKLVENPIFYVTCENPDCGVWVEAEGRYETEYDATIAAWNRRALPAVDTSALGAVVKPLVWVQSGGTHVMDHECHTVPTGYTVRYADEDGWKWTSMGLGAYGWEPTPAMAKAAAQADYETRILAALEPPDHAALLAEALRLPEVAALRTALDTIETMTATADGISPAQVVTIHSIAHAALEARHD